MKAAINIYIYYCSERKKKFPNKAKQYTNGNCNIKNGIATSGVYIHLAAAGPG
jgi:hypothetical protein